MPLHSVPARSKSTLISATGSWTVPAGVTKVSITAVGGGGGGGGGASGGANAAGGGGSGGFTVVEEDVNVTPGASLTITIGAKGTGGPVDTNGNDGTATSVTGAGNGMVYATGGLGGIAGVGATGGNGAASS